jgi:microcompartment protein CcmK/EutM
MSYVFHGNQKKTAKKIIKRLFRPKSGRKQERLKHSMVLLAQMQSGKTGTYLRVALDSIDNGYVNHVIIISGSRDTSLKGQTQKDLQGAIGSYCTDFCDGDGSLKRKLTERVQIYWSQDLKNVTKINDKTLIIHDESHAAQSKVNLPNKDFYVPHGLEKTLYGDDSQLKARNIWLMNVSATPFSELACNEKIKQNFLTDDERSIIGDNQLSEKSIVFGQPGASFRGVSHFIGNDSIHFESEMVKEESHEHISQILQRSKYDNKYCIVRTHKAMRDQALMESIADKTGCLYRSVFATTGDEVASEVFDFLKTEPDSKTLVHISGKARMGQVLDKTYIGMVYEQATLPNTDTILQSLLGRMCGYYDTQDPDIFLSSKVEDAVRHYARAWNHKNSKEFNKIHKAMNLKGSRKYGEIVEDEFNKPYSKIVPVKFTFADLYEGTNDDDKHGYWAIHEMFQNNPGLIDGNPDKVGILQRLEELALALAHGPPRHDIDKATYENSKNNAFQIFEDAIKNGTRKYKAFDATGERENVHICPFQLNMSKKKKLFFLVGVVSHDPDIHGEEIIIPNVLSKCNYAISSVETESGETIEDINGGQTFKFPFEGTADNLEGFKMVLRQFIERSDPHDLSSKCIRSMYCNSSKGYKGIYICKDIFPRKIIDNIQHELNQEFRGIDLQFSKFVTSDKVGYRRLDCIRW